MSSSLESAIPRRRHAAGRPVRHRHTIVPLALTALIGALAGNALAQGSAPAKGSAEHIAAVTKRVDGGFIRANAAKTPDWPSYGLDYAETRFSKFIFKGLANERGMSDFTGKLSGDDVEKIKAFIQGTADAIRPKN